MDNLHRRYVQAARAAAVVAQDQHTWVMSFLYIGTFGSFIGYSAAMPLLIKINFCGPDPAPLGTGINFAYYAFLGAAGRLARPAVRRLAGRQVRRRPGHPRRASSAMVVVTLGGARDARPG